MYRFAGAAGKTSAVRIVLGPPLINGLLVIECHNKLVILWASRGVVAAFENFLQAAVFNIVSDKGEIQRLIVLIHENSELE